MLPIMLSRPWGLSGGEALCFLASEASAVGIATMRSHRARSSSEEFERLSYSRRLAIPDTAATLTGRTTERASVPVPSRCVSFLQDDGHWLRHRQGGHATSFALRFSCSWRHESCWRSMNSGLLSYA